MLFSPKFWQFYAKGVIWSGLIFLPLFLLQNYLDTKNLVIPYLSEVIITLFSLGSLVVGIICDFSRICLTQGMSHWESSFFAYFISILIFGFVVGLYLTWTWTPSKEKEQTIYKNEDDAIKFQ